MSKEKPPGTASESAGMRPVDPDPNATQGAYVQSAERVGTPRTDAAYAQWRTGNLDWSAFARQLERELVDAAKDRAAPPDEELAARFHLTYERLAPTFGYVTRPETQAFDPESPNGKLMIAVVSQVRAGLPAHPSARQLEHEDGAHLYCTTCGSCGEDGCCPPSKCWRKRYEELSAASSEGVATGYKLVAIEPTHDEISRIEMAYLEAMDPDETDFASTPKGRHLAAYLRRAVLAAAPSAAPAAPVVIDLDADFWRQIKEAATGSPWMPPEYHMNDWVADVVEFLKGRGVSAIGGSVPAIELTVRQAIIDWNRAHEAHPLSIDLYEEGDLADAVLRALHVLRRADRGAESS